MNSEKHIYNINLKTLKIHIIIITLIAVFAKTVIFYKIKTYYTDTQSPIYVGTDASLYLSHIYNLYDGYGFSKNVDGIIKPTAYRPPLFQFTAFTLMKILNISKDYAPFVVVIINSLCWLLIIYLSIIIPYFITRNETVSIFSGYLTLFNINLFYNSLLLLNDTFFTTILSLFILNFIIYHKFPEKKLFSFINGILLGALILTRSVIKYFIVFIITFIMLIKGIKSKVRLLNLLIVIMSLLFVITPWLIRNYRVMNFIGIDTCQGVYNMWSMSILVEKNDNDKSLIKEIKEIIIKDRTRKEWFQGADDVTIEKKLNLSEIETSRYLQKLAFQTALSKKFDVLKIFMRNLLNNITSATSELKMIDILFKNGYYKEQQNIMLRLDYIFKAEETKKSISLKEFMIILPNLLLRILHLITFIIAIMGLFKLFKEYQKETILFTIIILYFLIFSSFVTSFDKYRVPIELILNFLISYKLVNFIRKNSN